MRGAELRGAAADTCTEVEVERECACRGSKGGEGQQGVTPCRPPALPREEEGQRKGRLRGEGGPACRRVCLWTRAHTRRGVCEREAGCLVGGAEERRGRSTPRASERSRAGHPCAPYPTRAAFSVCEAEEEEDTEQRG